MDFIRLMKLFFYSYFDKCFYHVRLGFVKWFNYTCWNNHAIFVLYYIMLAYYIDWFVYIQLTLTFWDKSHMAGYSI